MLALPLLQSLAVLSRLSEPLAPAAVALTLTWVEEGLKVAMAGTGSKCTEPEPDDGLRRQPLPLPLPLVLGGTEEAEVGGLVLPRLAEWGDAPSTSSSVRRGREAMMERGYVKT